MSDRQITETTRRGFITGIVALTGAATLKLKNIPTIYGDGEHDDWAGLQALIDGKPFRHHNKATCMRQEKICYFKSGKYLISKSLRFENLDSEIIAGDEFDPPELISMLGYPIFHFENCGKLLVKNFIFTSKQFDNSGGMIFIDQP